MRKTFSPVGRSMHEIYVSTVMKRSLIGVIDLYG